MELHPTADPSIWQRGKGGMVRTAGLKMAERAERGEQLKGAVEGRGAEANDHDASSENIKAWLEAELVGL